MAKMFYTIEEAAQRLGKTEEEVQAMASSGQIQEFRDRDKLVFKADQIDLLADDELDIDLGVETDDHDPADFSSMIPLADTGGASALGLESDTTLGESTLGESAGDTSAS
ncbi:MAG: helix-turn-helix domain-containing protein, partial [Planctomycetota bacterium]